jgi:hypothetical protein
MVQPSFTDEATIFSDLAALLNVPKTDHKLFEAIVNTPFQDKTTAPMLALGIVVLLLVNKKSKLIHRIALSDTEPAKGAVDISEKEFHKIKIPLEHTKNAIAKAIQSGKEQLVTDWLYLFTPAMDAKASRFNQAGAGIGCSVVYPLTARDGGALIFSYYQTPDKITKRHHKYMSAYRDLVNEALSR